MTPRALGRATLARRMLLARERVPTLRAIERLTAVQAQLPRTAFVALWTHLKAFRSERLARLLVVDGRVAGTWSVERTKSAAVLLLGPFAALPKTASTALHEEASALLRFVEPDATSFDVRIAKAGGRKTGSAGRIRAS